MTESLKTVHSAYFTIVAPPLHKKRPSTQKNLPYLNTNLPQFPAPPQVHLSLAQLSYSIKISPLSRLDIICNYKQKQRIQNISLCIWNPQGLELSVVRIISIESVYRRWRGFLVVTGGPQNVVLPSLTCRAVTRPVAPMSSKFSPCIISSFKKKSKECIDLSKISYSPKSFSFSSSESLWSVLESSRDERPAGPVFRSTEQKCGQVSAARPTRLNYCQSRCPRVPAYCRRASLK